MKRKILLLLLALILLGGLAGSEVPSDRVIAQSGIELNWWMFAGSSGPQSGGDVQLNATLGQAVIGSAQGGTISLSNGYWYPGAGPTAVEISNFEAIWQGENVLVTWKTETEVDMHGFNLYRGDSQAGPWEQINIALIPTQFLGSPSGGTYEWLDTEVTRGRTLYYYLEVLDFQNRSAIHGPIQVSYRHYLPMINH